MLGSSFNSYLALATVFGAVISAPVNSTPPQTLRLSKRGNAALDAANAAQSATSYLVCQLSYQTKAAAFSIGIGSKPVPCVAPGSSSSSSSTSAVAAVAVTSDQTGTPLSPSVPEVHPVVISTPSYVSTCSSSDPAVCALQAEALLAHNNARALHHAQPLVWNDTLAAGALRWAENAQWKHSGGILWPQMIYGENLYASTLNFPQTTMTGGIDAFLSEESVYDYNNPGFSEATGHFTQVVWKATQQVGCALVNVPLDVFLKYTPSSAMLICEYFPAGNYLTLFAENVQAP